MKLWGGRFSEGSSEAFERFSGSLHFDKELFDADIAGSQAWSRALQRVGIFNEDEGTILRVALEELLEDARNDPGYFEVNDEDVHTLVLRKLGEKRGMSELAQRLHTGRSRNEQVSTDLRLWIRREIRGNITQIYELLDALLTQAEQNTKLVMPGYTHLRRAQPVLWGHYLLAYYEMFARDLLRLRTALDSSDDLPLGSGALAGAGIPLDRQALANELGFSRITRNSLDATADRDFVLEYIFAAVTTFLHLSRLAEDWILYSSDEFGFLDLSDQVTSGSSLMPQKKNPDSLELLRGKTGRILGHLMSLSTVLKGTPLSYNRDMQEDKETVFDTARQLAGALEMATVVVATVKPKPEAMELAAGGGWSCATDLAEYLALHGVPFHQAHQIVGTIVRKGLDENRPPESWTIEQLREFSEAFGEDCLRWLQGASGVARREIEGGTGPGVVAQAVRDARWRLQRWQASE